MFHCGVSQLDGRPTCRTPHLLAKSTGSNGSSLQQVGCGNDVSVLDTGRPRETPT